MVAIGYYELLTVTIGYHGLTKLVTKAQGAGAAETVENSRRFFMWRALHLGEARC